MYRKTALRLGSIPASFRCLLHGLGLSRLRGRSDGVSFFGYAAACWSYPYVAGIPAHLCQVG